MKTPLLTARNQIGAMLLEALISILIFSIGILAIVGLQASSIKLASDAKYRSDASLAANKMIGQMWLANSSPSFVTDFSSPDGALYTNWVTSDVAAVLPIAGGISSPAVTIVPSNIMNAGVAVASTASSTVTIDIFWSVPGEADNTPSVHRYTTRAQITH